MSDGPEGQTALKDSLRDDPEEVVEETEVVGDENDGEEAGEEE